MVEGSCARSRRSGWPIVLGMAPVTPFSRASPFPAFNYVSNGETITDGIVVTGNINVVCHGAATMIMRSPEAHNVSPSLTFLIPASLFVRRALMTGYVHSRRSI